MKYAGMSRKLLLASCLSVSGLALGKPPTAEEQAMQPAIPYVTTQRLMLESIVHVCSAQIPASKYLMEQHMADWLRENAAQLASADAALNALPSDQRDSLIQKQQATTASSSAKLDFVIEHVSGANYCDTTFSSLARSPDIRKDDAQSFKEAVGAYTIRILVVEKLAPRCIQLVPEIGPEIDSDLAKWRKNESNIRGVAMAEFERMRASDPRAVAQLKSIANETIDTTLDMLEKTSTEHISVYCRKHFADLASGVRRLKTPMSYQLLEDSTNIK